MKILYLQANRGLGNGISAYIAELAHRRDAGHCFVLAFAAESQRGEIARYYGIPKDHVFLLEAGRERGVGWTDLRRLADFVRRHGIGIVHAHALRAGMVAVLLKVLARARIEIVYTNHGIRYLQLRNPVRRLWTYAADKLVGRVAGATVCITSWETSVARKAGLASDGALAFIRTRVDLGDAEVQPQSRQDLVLGVGPAGLEKGTDRFVDVAEEVRKLGTGVRFEWLGDHSAFGDRKSDAVAWPGRLSRAEVFARFRAAKVLLVCSRVDTYPIAVLEAYAAGLPVVFLMDYPHADYRAPGMPELPPTALGEAARVIWQIVHTSDLHLQLSASARDWFDEHGRGADQFAEEYSAIYRKLEGRLSGAR